MPEPEIPEITEKSFWWTGGDGIFGWFQRYWQFMVGIPERAWRVGGALCKVGGMIFGFAVLNADLMSRFVEKMPGMIEKALNIFQNILNVGGNALTIVVPASFSAVMEFVNTALPLSEAFAAISGLAGVYILSVMIRIIKNLLIVWR